MKRFLFLSILYLCLCASAQTPTFTVSAPNQAIVGEKFNLVFTTNARKASGFRISSVVSIPKEIGGLHVVGCPPLPQQKEASVSESTPTIAYTYILRGDSVGTYTIPAAFLTVDGKELETTPVEVRIQSADAARPEEAAAQTAGSPSQTQEKKELSVALKRIAEENGMNLKACCEPDVAVYGIDCTGCMSAAVLSKAAGVNLRFSESRMQSRKGCRCILSNDIGVYNTCSHGCIYCYANYSQEKVEANLKEHDVHSPLLIGHIRPGDRIVDVRDEENMQTDLFDLM